MNPKKSTFVASFLIITAFLMLAYFYLGVERVENDMIKFQKSGGIRDITENGVEMENLARFAVEEHNKKENSILKFCRLVKAKGQVVAGMMYYLTLEATDAAGKRKVYETKVWVQAWNDFKQVQEFKVQKAGGIRDLTEDQGLNAAEMESLARFAVEEKSKTVNCIMKFHRLVKAKEQVVAGKMYHLTVETTDGYGGISVHESKVWVKPWMNFKEVQEFNPSNDPSI